MKRLIILFLAILIPLLSAFFVGRYAYTDRYSPDNPTSQPAIDLRASLFGDFLDQGKTTKEKLELYLKFRTIEYNPTPIFSETIKNNQDRELYHIDIYTSLYNTLDANDNEVERVAFTFHVYNVQYETIRDTFITEDRAGVLASPRPVLVIVLESPDGLLSFRTTLALGNAGGVPIVVDSGRDIDEVVGALIGDAKAGIRDWLVSSVTVNVNTILVLGGQNVEQTISTFTVDSFDTNINNINREDYVQGFNGSYDSLGIRRAIFTRYVWWQSLLTFVVIGVITISFYIVYSLEEKAQLERMKKMKNQKVAIQKKKK